MIGNKKIRTGPYGFFATPDGSVRLNPEGTRLLEKWLNKYPMPVRLFVTKYRSLYLAAERLGLSGEEINSLCLAGACTAMCLYDPAFGTKFETFAAPHFRSKVQHHLRDMLKASRYGHGEVSIHSPINHNGTELQFIVGERDPDDGNNPREELMSYLRLLCPRDREVLSLRTGLNGPALSLSEIARIYECSKEYIRQIEKKALQTIRLGVA